MQFGGAAQQMFHGVSEPAGEVVRGHDIVQNDFERPRSCKAHRRFHQHGDQYYDQSPAVGPDQTKNQASHAIVSCLSEFDRADLREKHEKDRGRGTKL